jgi:hypothetical protein
VSILIFTRKKGTYYDPKIQDVFGVMLKTLRETQPTDLKLSMNLIFINYDQTKKQGELQLFVHAQEEGNTFATMLKPCVIKVV